MIAVSSGEKSASALIKGKGGYLIGMLVNTDGTNALTINIYDNTAASGDKLVANWVVTSSSTDRVQYLPLFNPVSFRNGCYVSVSGSGTYSYTVYYS